MAKDTLKVLRLISAGPNAILKRIEQVPAFAHENPRESKPADESTMASLVQNGQLVAGRALVTKISEDGKVLEAITLQGNLRHKAVEELHNRGLLDPKTGKVFDSLEVLLHPIGSLTDVEIHNYIHDHSNVTDLDRFETYKTFCNHFRANLSDEQMLISSGALLERNFFGGNTEIPTTKVADGKGGFTDVIDYTAWASKKRGRIQHLERIFRAPTVMRLAGEEQLKGGRNLMKDTDVRDLFKIFRDEMKEANDGKLIDKGIAPESITVDKPGPKFTEKWAQLLRQRAEAEAKGIRSKGIAMLNNAAVTKMKDNATSGFIKAILNIVLNARPQDKIIGLQNAILPFEQPGHVPTAEECETLQREIAAVNALPAVPLLVPAA